MELAKGKKNSIYVGCCLLMASIMLSAMGLNNTMFKILEHMGGLQHYALMAVLSGFGSSIMCLVGASLGQMYGRRLMSLLGTGVAMVCMIVMGLTGNLLIFILARALLSFGVGIYTPQAYAICAAIFSREQYTVRVGILGSILATTTFLGSLVAGALVDRGLIAASIIYPGIVGLAGALIIFLFLPKEECTPKKIDVTGIFFLSLLLAGVSYSFTFASGLGFGHWSILLGFLVTIASSIAFYKVENRIESPLIPFRLFRNPKITGVCFIGALAGVYNIVMGVYVPVTGQAIMGLSATVTGWFSMPRMALAIVLPLVLAAWANKKPGNMRVGIIITCICCTIPFVGFAFTNANTMIWVPFALLAFTGVTEGYRNVCLNPLLVRQLQPEDVSIGIGLSTTCNTLGPTMATAVLGAVYNARVETNMNGALISVYAITAGIGLIATLIAVFALKEKRGPASA